MEGITHRRARRRGYRREELPDLRQDLAPTLAAFRFDAAKSNGACERTVLVSIIDRQLAMALRTRARWQRLRAEYSDACASAERQRAERREVAHEIEVDRATDVASALGTLAPVEQTVARALMKGERLSAIAKRLGRTRYDIERLLERIRDHFRVCGVDAWVVG
jgi:DNA-binding NarL/FixJ family response regulator